MSRNECTPRRACRDHESKYLGLHGHGWVMEEARLSNDKSSSSQLGGWLPEELVLKIQPQKPASERPFVPHSHVLKRVTLSIS